VDIQRPWGDKVTQTGRGSFTGGVGFRGTMGSRCRLAGRLILSEVVMAGRINRRRFLRAAAAGGAVLGAADLSFLSRLRPVSAADASLEPRAAVGPVFGRPAEA
jgi:hypothetical protein